MAWSAQALEHTAHRRHTDVYAPLIGDAGAQLLSGHLRGVVDQPLDQCVSGRVQGGSLAARVRFGRHVPCRAVTVSPLRDTRETDAEEVRKRALGAEPALASLKNLWP